MLAEFVFNELGNRENLFVGINSSNAYRKDDKRIDSKKQIEKRKLYRQIIFHHFKYISALSAKVYPYKVHKSNGSKLPDFKLEVGAKFD